MSAFTILTYEYLFQNLERLDFDVDLTVRVFDFSESLLACEIIA